MESESVCFMLIIRSLGALIKFQPESASLQHVFFYNKRRLLRPCAKILLSKNSPSLQKSRTCHRFIQANWPSYLQNGMSVFRIYVCVCLGLGNSASW